MAALSRGVVEEHARKLLSALYVAGDRRNTPRARTRPISGCKLHQKCAELFGKVPNGGKTDIKRRRQPFEVD